MGDIRSNVIPLQAADGAAASGAGSLLDNLLTVAGAGEALLPDQPAVLTAGLDYGVFPSDHAVSTWSGFNLLDPEVARTTLLVTLRRDEGALLIAGRYFDTVLWTIGAWEYYLATLDRTFLEVALEATENALRLSEAREFDAELGLFRGPAVWADGISAYPDRWAREVGGRAHIMAWPALNPDRVSRPGFGIPMHALSTNCVFFRAYELAGEMRRALGLPKDEEWAPKAVALKTAINAHFWREDAGCYRYLVDRHGGSDAQEGFGHSFAILFGVADAAKTERILDTLHITPEGIPCIWPNFPRYETADGSGFGNHCGTVWPPISGLWAEAAARSGRIDAFALELTRLADRACRDNQFAEIYHPLTGRIYGGLQEGVTGRTGATMQSFLEARLGIGNGALPAAMEVLFPAQASRGDGIRLWQACTRQTWSATAYVRMVLRGLFGIDLTEEGMRFAPVVPDGLGPVRLFNLGYRGAVIDIEVRGSGSRVTSLTINGRPASLLPAEAAGRQRILIELAGG